MKYRNRIQEPGTTISGFADSKKKKKKKNNADRTTLDFFLHVTVNTHIFFGPIKGTMTCSEFKEIKY